MKKISVSFDLCFSVLFSSASSLSLFFVGRGWNQTGHFFLATLPFLSLCPLEFSGRVPDPIPRLTRVLYSLPLVSVALGDHEIEGFSFDTV